MLQPTLTKLDDLGVKATTELLCIAYDAAEHLGEVDRQDLARGKLVDTGKNSVADGSALLRVASRRLQLGQIQAAEGAYRRAAEIFLEAGAIREWAIARGGVADMMWARGQLDDALRIRVEEQLPVYERLGDVRSKAVALWNIVKLLKLRGESGQHAKHNILQYLVEAFETFQYLKVPQGIGIVGCELARVLSARGRIAEALVVLDATEKAYLFLNDEDGVAETRVLRSEAELGD